MEHRGICVNALSAIVDPDHVLPTSYFNKQSGNVIQYDDSSQGYYINYFPRCSIGLLQIVPEKKINLYLLTNLGNPIYSLLGASWSLIINKHFLKVKNTSTMFQGSLFAINKN